MTYCELVEHENGIYEVILLESSRQAVEAYFTMLEEVTAELPEGSHLRIMLNLTQSGVPPFMTASRRGRQFINKNRDKISELHIAFLAKSNAQMVLGLVDSFMKLMPIDATMRAFGDADHEQAVAWLLEE